MILGFALVLGLAMAPSVGAQTSCLASGNILIGPPDPVGDAPENPMETGDTVNYEVRFENRSEDSNGVKVDAVLGVTPQAVLACADSFCFTQL